ncbi:hypothetical protein JW848_10390 [Candidatus Bipolaricaulota bacterium]|nr:hypothetical protein [Candidatus Bipolaricaulota bacterium]
MMMISRKAQRQIDRYVRGVERALKDLDPVERLAVLDDLRSHIHEELSKLGTVSPTPDNVQTVLSAMDAPASYRPDSAPEPPDAGRVRTLGRVAFALFLAGLAAAALGLLLGALVSSSLLWVFFAIAGALALCAVGFGIAGWRSPYGKAAVIGAVLVLATALVFLPSRQTTTPSPQPEVVVEKAG